jgi:RNA polymerase sigma-70 factor (ECF subfamily)
MFFAICHPAISEKAQISLALRILCGFGITEIADALMTNKESVNKLLQRAKEKLRTENIKLGMPDDDQLKTKLDTVLRTVYLLFNEGYYSESSGSLIRKDLCLEAINLAYLLLRHNITNTHETNSLISLMCFHSSRLEARMSETGEIILYEDQDEKLWDKALIEKGFYYLQQASKWEIVSKYYLEASIAYWHTVKNDTKEKWESILSLYNLLLKIDETPNAALNRIYALSKVKGNEYAVKELESQEFEENHFYYLLMGELYNDLDKTKAKESFVKAKNLCKTETGKKLIVKKLETLQA